jgi:hypothetical protein
MAQFCVATGYTPEQFWNLTLEDYDAMVKELNRRK